MTAVTSRISIEAVRHYYVKILQLQANFSRPTPGMARCSRRNLFGLLQWVFNRPDALPIIQPTVSKP